MQAFKSYRANIQKNKKATNKKTDRGENNIVRFSEKSAYKNCWRTQLDILHTVKRIRQRSAGDTLSANIRTVSSSQSTSWADRILWERLQGGRSQNKNTENAQENWRPSDPPQIAFLNPKSVEQELEMDGACVVHSVVVNVLCPRFAPHVDEHSIGRVFKTRKHDWLPVAFLVNVRIVVERESIWWPKCHQADVFLVNWGLKIKVTTGWIRTRSLVDSRCRNKTKVAFWFGRKCFNTFLSTKFVQDKTDELYNSLPLRKWPWCDRPCTGLSTDRGHFPGRTALEPSRKSENRQFSCFCLFSWASRFVYSSLTPLPVCAWHRATMRNKSVLTRLVELEKNAGCALIKSVVLLPRTFSSQVVNIESAHL